MISHEHEVIFIHIPKTAGTSIEAALGHRHEQDHRSLRELQWPHAGPVQFASATNRLEVATAIAHSIQRSRNRNTATTVSKAQYRSYFKFTVVRNPWDRAFSLYRNVFRDSVHRKRLGIRADMSFSEFIRRYSGVDLLRPQLHWIVDFKGRIGVDFVCRFENLYEDFAEAIRRAGLPDNTLPHLLPSEGPHYTSAYDANTERLVADRYRREIKLLGYSFYD